MKLTKLTNAAAMTVLLFLASCSSRTEYTHALPKNASAVVALDLDAMAGKGGLKDGGGKPLADKLTALLKSGLQGEAARLAERIVANPKESGLALDEKLYLFSTPHATAFAALAKVDDTSKLEKLLEVLHDEGIASEIKKESGCRWAQVGQAVCAFNNGTFLAMQHAKGDASGIRGTLFSLMRQQEGEGFAALPEFGSLKAKGNDIASVADFSAMPQRWTTPLRMGLSAEIDLQDIKYLTTANFERGRLTVESSCVTSNASVKDFFRQMNQITSPLSGRNLELYPAQTAVWMGGKIHGATLYDMLGRNPSIRQALNNPVLPVDVKRIFASLEGDFSIGILSLDRGDFLAYADVTERSFLRTFEELRPLLALTGGQVKLYDTAPDKYALQTYDAVYWFGVKGNRFYVTNHRQLAEEAGRTYGVSPANRQWKEEARKNRVFVSLQPSETGLPFAQLVESVTVGIPEWDKARMEVVMKNQDENALRTIVRIVEEM